MDEKAISTLNLERTIDARGKKLRNKADVVLPKSSKNLSNASNVHDDTTIGLFPKTWCNCGRYSIFW